VRTLSSDGMSAEKTFAPAKAVVRFGHMNAAPQPACFQIGPLPIYGDLILAPMDGYTDQPMRRIARRFGSAMSYTEFINAMEVLYGHPHLEKRLTFTAEERPLVYQIFDSEPERIIQAAIRLRQRNPDVIDINMGCSARSVSGRGAGAGLLRQPTKIAQIFNHLTHILDIPITAKIRLGWDEESRNYLEIAHIVEDNGGALIAVHARTRSQTYFGQADWPAIAEIKQTVNIPVIANGDVRTTADIRSIQAQTGCDAVMIGRGSFGNPWIFARRERDEVSIAETRAAMLEHLQETQNFYGDEYGMIVFRKHALGYLRPYAIPPELRQRLLTTLDHHEWLDTLDAIFSRQSRT